MEIRKRTIDILKERCGERLYPERFSESRYESFNAEVYSIMFCVDEKYDREKGEKYLEARIRWRYTDKYTLKRNFPSSQEGFEQACEWLDKQRVRFAETLLGDATDW